MIDPDVIIVIAEFLGKSAILIALGFVFVVGVRRLSPATKHSLMLRVFASGILIPLLWLVLPRWGLIPSFSSEKEGATSQAVNLSTATTFSEREVGPAIFNETPLAPGNEGSLTFGWPELLFALWVLGMIAFLIRSLTAARFLRKLERGASPADDAVYDRFTALHENNCPQSKVELLESSAVNSAFTWGIVRPRIVLPREASGWTSADLEMVLMHELEHVRRRDALAVLVSRIFLALNWVNPLAWIAVRKTVQLREDACDRRVLQSGYTGQNYAEMLFRQASVVSSPIWRTSATAVAENGTIEQRIKMILNPSNKTKGGIDSASSLNKILPTAFILIVFLVGMAGFAEVEKGSASDVELTTRMESIILPNVEFSDTPLSDALRFLQQRSVELDPDKKGIVILDTRKRGKDFAETLITLKLSNVPIEEAIRYSASLAQLQYSLKNGAVVVEERDLKQLAAAKRADKERQSQTLIRNQRKLKEIILPSIEFRDTPLRDALQFLQLKSVELDVATAEPKKKGVNVILEQGLDSDVRITLKLTNVPLSEAFRYTASLAQAEFEIEAHAIRIFPTKESGNSSEYSAEAKQETAAVRKKLEEIILPALEFRETPLGDALRFIQQRSVELDSAASDSGMKGINIVLDGGDKAGDERVTLKVTNATLESVLKYTATLAGGEIEVGPNAVVVRIPGE